MSFTIKRVCHIFLLYLWAKYESIWKDFTIKTVILVPCLFGTKIETKITMWTVNSGHMGLDFAHK